LEPEIVDLRSDTVTLPSPAMREAMAAAPVGDDVFSEDPTIHALEELAAELTGKEAGLFVPSGCMANLIAQMVHVRRGDEVVLGAGAHTVLHEVGAGAAIAGVQYSVIPGNGLFTADQVEERVKAPTFHTPGTGLVWIENSQNAGGGLIFPQAEVEKIAAVCRRHGLPLHLDGARMFNVAVASGKSAAEIAAPFDSLSFCLSKGLGAPVGSVLCGTKAFRVAAHRLRKMLGGGMRQAGIVAAAGIYALRHNVERLAEDHARARRLAHALAPSPHLRVDPAAVQTNIVVARLPAGEAEELVARCERRGVRFLDLDRRRVRLVTHLDVDGPGIERAAKVIAEEAAGLALASHGRRTDP
jgi:threonine aldolase